MEVATRQRKQAVPRCWKRQESAFSPRAFRKERNTANFFFLRWSFTLVAQAGVQGHGLGSLQPLPPVVKGPEKGSFEAGTVQYPFSGGGYMTQKAEKIV